MLPPLPHGPVYKALRIRKGLTQQQVADHIGMANRQERKRATKRDKEGKRIPPMIHREFVGQIERVKRFVPEAVPADATEYTDSIRDDFDMILALGEGEAGDWLMYALGTLRPDDQLELIQPVGMFGSRDVADAVALLVRALGLDAVAVVPVWSGFVDERDATVLEADDQVMTYLAAVALAGDR